MYVCVCEQQQHYNGLTIYDQLVIA